MRLLPPADAFSCKNKYYHDKQNDNSKRAFGHGF